jgi:hypothetical protein
MATDVTPISWAVRAFSGRRSAAYQRRNDYLNGNHPLGFASPKFRDAFGRTFEAFAYNRCNVVVDAHADRLQIAGFTLAGAKENDPIAKDLEMVWQANRMDVQEGQIEREQFGLGDAWLVVEMDPATGIPLMWPQEADSVRVRYSYERPGHVIMAAKRWVDDEGNRRITLYFEDRVERYISGRVIGALEGFGDAGQAYTLIDGDEGTVVQPITDTVPVFHFANNAPIGRYGISELQDVIPLQDALNKTLLDMMVAMEFAAYPQRYMIDIAQNGQGHDAAVAAFQTGINRILELYSVTGEDGERVTPTVGQFAAANIKGFEDAAEFLDKLISRVSRVPVHHLQMTSSFPNGISQRMADAQFARKMTDRQRAAGATWSDAMRYVGRLRGHKIEPGQVQVKWEPVAPLSDEETLAMALDRQALGYSFEDNLREMGKAPDDITRIVTNANADRAAESARQERLTGQGLLPLGAGIGSLA